MQNNRNNHWKGRVQEIIHTCQEELKRTTEIGKKMLSASKTNTCLHDSYEELGSLVFKAIKEGELEWKDSRVSSLIKRIESCEEDLGVIEEEVNKIRFSAGPIDVSSKESYSSEKDSEDKSN